MNKQRGFTGPELLIVVWFALAAAGVIGWIMNIYKLTQLCCDLSGWLVMRAIGVFLAPLGAVLGFL